MECTPAEKSEGLILGCGQIEADSGQGYQVNFHSIFG